MSEWLDSTILRTCRIIDRWDSRGREEVSLAARDQMAPGAVVSGRFRLESVLGEGGMGRVWLAQDERENHPVALKEMRIPHGAGTPAGGAEGVDVAFKREFFTMTKLQHPNTVKVYDYGVLESGNRFIAMEVVRGQDLSKLLQRGPLAVDQAMRILLDLAQVLGFVHSRLYVHCDLKSDNVRITERRAVKLMDFGLMHQLGTPAGGTLKGTVYYMAPEIPKGGIIDARTDLYALGVLGFEMLTGRYPFDGKSLLEIIGQHLEKPPPRLSAYREVSEPIQKLIDRLLAKDPAQRHYDTEELIRELGAISGAPVEIQSYGARTSYLHCAELIGRGEEQRTLQSALERVGSGEGRSLFVTAPAGAGKTRLLQEFRLAVKLADLPYLVGQCRAEGQAPLAPLVEALTQLVPLTPPESLAKHRGVVSRIIPAMADPGQPPPSGPPLEKGALFDALTAWLQDVARAHPFILVLEDLHWADAATLEYLNVVIRALAQKHAMVLGTFRSNEVDRLSTLFQTVDDGTTGRLELPFLTREDTSTLVSAMLRGLVVSEGFLERLYQATKGNAFFVTETMRAFIEDGTLRSEAGRWTTALPPEQIALPETIKDVVGRRLAILPPEMLALARKIAPLGRHLDLRVVKQVAQVPDEQLFAAIDGLVERQFLQHADGDLYFSHDTVRDGIYRSMPDFEQRAAHQALAQVLEELHADQLRERAELLGYHYSRGDDVQKAIHYLLIASETAQQRRMMLRTVQLLAQAADLVESVPYQGKIDKLIELWAKIVELGLVGHVPSCIKYAEKLFALWEKRVDFSESARAFHAAQRRLIEGRHPLRKRKLRKIWSDEKLDPASRDPLHLMPKVALYRCRQAISYASLGMDEKNREVVRRQYADNPDPGPLRATAVVSEGLWLQQTGQLAALRQRALEALEWYDRHMATIGVMPKPLYWDYAYCHSLFASEQAFSGKPIDLERWQKGIRICEQAGMPEAAVPLYIVGTASRAATAGDADEMTKNYDAITERIRRLGNPQNFDSRIGMFLGVYWLQRGEKEMADAICGRLEKWREKLPFDNWLRRYSMTYRAIFHADHAGPDLALKSLAEAKKAADEVPSFRLGVQLRCAAARVELKGNRRAAARELAEEALRSATSAEIGNPWDETVARRHLAEALEGEAAEQMANQAVELARRHQQPLHEALGLFTLGRLVLPRDRSRAATLLGEAEQRLRALRCVEFLRQIDAFRQQAAR